MKNTRNLLGNKTLDNRVGATYGDRMRKKNHVENQKTQTIQRPPRRQPVDNFANKDAARSTKKFANKKDRYAGKSHRPKGMVAHKTVGTELLERGNPGTPPSDADILTFLDKIQTNETLWSGLSISRHYAAKAAKTKPKASSAAKQTVAGMARAKARAGAPNGARQATRTGRPQTPRAATPQRPVKTTRRS